ncbi:MAG: formate dehydrogenase accessory protein FdhE [Dehalococcoidia bacterium]|nr:formate dehydrogenase accessory protein FdhE [Dehalococcoidia bacterium]
MLKGRDRDRAIIERLEGWEKAGVRFPDAVDRRLRLLRLAIEAQPGIGTPTPHLTRDAVSALLMQGKHILSFDDIRLDRRLFQEIFRDVVGVLVAEPSGDQENSRRLNQLAANYPLLQQVAREYYSGTPLSGTATEHCVDAAVLEACVGAALNPFLKAYSEVLSALVGQELWRRKNCPICGGWADFAYLESEVGARWLMCSRCGMEWLFQRIQCPYCGTQKHQSLAYRTNSQGLYRLYTCEECHSYVKAIDLRRASSEVLLPLERIVTADLDRQAMEANYGPGHRSHS